MAPLFGIWCFGMWRKRNGEVLGPQLHVDLAQDSKQNALKREIRSRL